MNKRKICLFTAHSPQTGGGGVILRSLINSLPELSISWHYIGDGVVKGHEKGYLGKSIMGGNMVKDIWQTWKMLSGKRVLLIDEVVKQLLSVECDEYWVVSHNEGLRVAIELVKQQKRLVHLTVHDDWAGALCTRSNRYFFMSGLAKKITINALKSVSSFDVISCGMRDYYEQLSNKTGNVCHRYIPGDAIKYNKFLNSADKITVGHIGSIYDKNDLIAFLTVLQQFMASKGKKAVLQMWGCHLTVNDIPTRLRDSIVFFNTLPEEKVIPQLSKCDFVYCMYPLKKILAVFTETSLPTKLTSYLQAGRPILGHGPANSTLTEFLKTTSLGVMWTSKNKNDGLKALQEIFEQTITIHQLENARAKYFGEKNLAAMRKVFSN